jgi:hypothetical protein
MIRRSIGHQRKAAGYWGLARSIRSRGTILQADEATLIRDVRFDVDKAQRKLNKIRARIDSLQEYAAAELQLLRDADAKLCAAIVAALLSTREGKSNGS